MPLARGASQPCALPTFPRTLLTFVWSKPIIFLVNFDSMWKIIVLRRITLSFLLLFAATAAGALQATAGIDTVAASARATPDTIRVHGRVVAGQIVAAGAYADTVTITVPL